MNKRASLRALGLAMAMATTLAAGPAAVAAEAGAGEKSLARGVVQTQHGGVSPALRLESKDAQPKAVVLPEHGARVIAYGLGAEGSILWSGPAGEGGFWTEFGPEVMGLPAQPLLAGGKYDWSVRKGSLVVMKSEDEKEVGGAIEKEVMFDPSSGELGFLFRMKNTRERDAALSFWHRIACRPGGYVLVPLSKKSRFPSGWSVRQESGGKVSWNGSSPKAEGVKVLDGVLVGKTGSGAGRVGADSDAQWMAYALGRTLFIVHFPYYANAVYAEGGNSVTFAWDATRTELQPMGPEARVRSRKTAELPMKWMLVELPSEVTTEEQARALVSQVPASPFL